MSEIRLEKEEIGYKCSRCSGVFGSQVTDLICCPYCGMLCEELSCRVTDSINGEN